MKLKIISAFMRMNSSSSSSSSSSNAQIVHNLCDSDLIL
jgi:hypothetical protein